MHPGEILITAAIGFTVVGMIVYGVSIYNGLIAMKNNIGRSWANIDVLLKQRHDELPKLIKTCEGYMQHERAVFDALAQARAGLYQAKTVGERAAAESALTQALGRFFAVAEAYPDLKANQSFLALQNRISELENSIADRREFYNDTVTTFNTRIEQLPDKFIADACRYERADLFKVSDKDREDVEVSFKMAG
jgi:LemA protein